MPTQLAADRPRLVLASGSPRRRALLASVGVVPEVVVADIDETPAPLETAQELVARLARQKAEAAASLVSGENALVLGSDTVVEVDGTILGKPATDLEAIAMLGLLSNSRHRVHTGVCLLGNRSDGGGDSIVDVATTTVRMRTLSDADISWYLATGEHEGKAGAYAIQGYAAQFVTGVEGPYDGIVGLPLNRVDQLLTRFGWPLRLFAGDPDGNIHG